MLSVQAGGPVLGPQHPRNSQMCTPVISVLGWGCRQVAHPRSSLAGQPSPIGPSRLNERPCLKNKVESSVWRPRHQPLASRTFTHKLPQDTKFTAVLKYWICSVFLELFSQEYIAKGKQCQSVSWVSNQGGLFLSYTVSSVKCRCVGLTSWTLLVPRKMTGLSLHLQGPECVQYLQQEYLPSLQVAPEIIQVRALLTDFAWNFIK